MPDNTAAPGRCCLRRWLLELAGGGEGWWCRLLLLVVAACGGDGCWWWRLLEVAAATAAGSIVVLPFDLMHFAILNLSLMYVYFLCLLITYNIPPCSFTLFLFYKLDIHAHLFTHLLFLLHT